MTIQVLVRRSEQREVCALPDPREPMCATSLLCQLSAVLKNVVVDTATDSVYGIYDHFPSDGPVLLTSWSEYWDMNGRPRSVRLELRPKAASSAAVGPPTTTTTTDPLVSVLPSAGAVLPASGTPEHGPAPAVASEIKRSSTNLDAAPLWRSSPAGGHAGLGRSVIRQAIQRENTFFGGGGVGSSAMMSTPYVSAAGAAGRGRDTASSVGGEADDGSGSRYVPLRIFLVRHGESVTNVDKKKYEVFADHAVPLTERGKSMAQAAGQQLRATFEALYGSKRDVDHHVRMYVSPFRRTRETAEGLLAALNGPGCGQWVDSVRENTLLAEQDWGAHEGEGKLAATKYQEEMARNALKAHLDGRFWARMPNGESPFDVCKRVGVFVPDVVMASQTATAERPPMKTVIVVSHGVTIRAFLTNWCRYSPEWYSASVNPPNCSIQLLEDQHDRGYIFGGWNLDTPLEQPISPPPVRGADPQQVRWARFLSSVAHEEE